MTSHEEATSRSLIVDGHLDLAFNAQLGYDFSKPLHEARTSETGRLMTARGETPTVSLPELRAANVGVVFGTLFAMPASAPSDLRGPRYSTADEAHMDALGQIDYYRRLEREGLIQVIESRSLLAEVIEARHDPPRPAQDIGLVLLIEGGDPIRTPEELDHWFDLGVRIVGPAWSRTRYSGGTMAPGPLTEAGRELMARMQPAGMVLDASHMAEESFWQALKIFDGPVIATHSNCRRFVPTDRQLTDEMIRAIVDRDGVVGVVLFNRFLDATWTPDDGKVVGLEVLIQHIEHICEIAGDTGHVGIGSDLDGGFGREGIPTELDSCVDLPLIEQALLHTGWRAEHAAGVMGGNWLRWLRGALPAG